MPQLKKCFADEADALRVFRQEVDKNLCECRKEGIFFSFTTDPLVEETRWLTVHAADIASSLDVPVRILTKDVSFGPDDDIFSILRQCKKHVSIGFTLTGHDEMEPNASENYDRLSAMGALHSLGFGTFASLEPVIDWDATWEMVEHSIDRCDHYMMGLRSGVPKSYYDINDIYLNVEAISEYIRAKGRTIYLKKSIRDLYKDDSAI